MTNARECTLEQIFSIPDALFWIPSSRRISGCTLQLLAGKRQGQKVNLQVTNSPDSTHYVPPAQASWPGLLIPAPAGEKQDYRDLFSSVIPTRYISDIFVWLPKEKGFVPPSCLSSSCSPSLSFELCRQIQLDMAVVSLKTQFLHLLNTG